MKIGDVVKRSASMKNVTSAKSIIVAGVEIELSPQKTTLDHRIIDIITGIGKNTADALNRRLTDIRVLNMRNQVNVIVIRSRDHARLNDTRRRVLSK